MTFGKFNHFICIIIIIFVSNSNAEASNSKCLQDWRRMGAQTAVGNYARTALKNGTFVNIIEFPEDEDDVESESPDGAEDAHGSVKISLTVEGLDNYHEYRGNYSITIKLGGNIENDGFINKEPIFIQEIGNNCIWKQDNGIWWIGNCDEIGNNNGFAFMNNCHCPWPSKNDFGSCNKCIWTKYSSQEKFACDRKIDRKLIACQFGIGFKREDYNELINWVGNICYLALNNNAVPGAFVVPGGSINHNSSGARLGQIVRNFTVPTSGQNCRGSGGKLKVRLSPPPRIIKCERPKAAITTTTTDSPANLCLTKSGPSLNQPCIFPFTYKDITYNGCPKIPNRPSQRWCSTEVDSNGNHIAGQRKWGHCSSNCPTQN